MEITECTLPGPIDGTSCSLNLLSEPLRLNTLQEFLQQPRLMCLVNEELNVLEEAACGI